MNRWDEAKRLVRNKKCGPVQIGERCGHAACNEADEALRHLDGDNFSDLVQTVLTNRLCRSARHGHSCNHQACIDVKETLEALGVSPVALH